MAKTFVIVDDHPLYRTGLRALISQKLSLTCGGEAATLQEARELLARVRPAIAIIDISLQNEDGLKLVAEAKSLYPEMGMLVVSMHDENLYGERAIKAGAKGYVMKHENPEVLVEAVRSILSGHLALSANLRNRCAERYATGASQDPSSCLTDREFEIFTRIGKGYGAIEIAAELNLSVKTINAHQDRIKNKLGLASSVELRRFAVEWSSMKTNP